MTYKALTPFKQKEVVFYEDMVTAILIHTDNRQEIFVPIRPICDYLGVDWSAQYRRINRDPVLAESVQGVAVTTTPSAGGCDGGLQALSEGERSEFAEVVFRKKLKPPE